MLLTRPVVISPRPTAAKSAYGATISVGTPQSAPLTTALLARQRVAAMEQQQRVCAAIRAARFTRPAAATALAQSDLKSLATRAAIAKGITGAQVDLLRTQTEIATREAIARAAQIRANLQKDAAIASVDALAAQIIARQNAIQPGWWPTKSPTRSPFRATITSATSLTAQAVTIPPPVPPPPVAVIIPPPVLRQAPVLSPVVAQPGNALETTKLAVLVPKGQPVTRAIVEKLTGKAVPTPPPGINEVTKIPLLPIAAVLAVVWLLLK